MPSRDLARLTLSLTLAVFLGACTTWSRRPMIAPSRDGFYAGPVRVTPWEGAPVLLDSVTVGRDSVIGREHAAVPSRIAIPMAEMRMMEARKTDPAGTVMAIFVPLLAAFALWSAYRLGRDGFND